MSSTGYKITHDWFSNTEIKANLARFLQPNEQHDILEVGSYEGLSACFFSNQFCNHPDSTLTCVDPFDLSDVSTPLTDNIRSNFHHNIATTANASKITVFETYSNKFFPENVKQFDMIYIDGSHIEEDIIYDMTEADKVLKIGGIMWMDDYMGGKPGQKIRETMDGFVEG